MNTNNELQDFAQLVRKMRDAQKAFFKNRSKENLKNAIRFEEKTDEKLKEIPEPPDGFFLGFTKSLF